MNGILARGLAVVALLAPELLASPASAKPPTSLLRYNASYYGGGTGVSYYDDDLSVARDRSVSAFSTVKRALDPLGLGWTSSRFSEVIGAEAYASLVRALNVNHAAQKSRVVCEMTGIAGAWNGSAQITWYGRTRSSFTIHFNGASGAPDCDAEVKRIYQAIMAFAHGGGPPVP